MAFDKKFLEKGTNQSKTNYLPEIEYFRSNKQSFKYGEVVTITWKTINADKVELKPFGKADPIGSKSIKIFNFKEDKYMIELIAENTLIGRSTSSIISLTNNTYIELYNHFKNIILKENTSNADSIIYSYNNNYFDIITIISIIIFIILINIIYYSL